jgi:hypothetical protein
LDQQVGVIRWKSLALLVQLLYLYLELLKSLLDLEFRATYCLEMLLALRVHCCHIILWSLLRSWVLKRCRGLRLDCLNTLIVLLDEVLNGWERGILGFEEVSSLRVDMGDGFEHITFEVLISILLVNFFWRCLPFIANGVEEFTIYSVAATGSVVVVAGHASVVFVVN